MGRVISLLFREFGRYCNRVAEAWNTFWYSPRNPYALCVMRCLVGWMAFYTTFVWGIELEAFFSLNSFNSAVTIQDHFTNIEGPYALSFWTWVPAEWMYQVHYACLAITFCFMIGLFTRVTSVLSLIILISYAYRARFSTFGLDQINIILTLYLCIGNSGAYFSVDRFFKRFFRRDLSQNPLEEPRATIATNIATRLIQFHFCVIYMAAGMGKLYGETWWDGSAMWRGLANAEYQTFDMTWMAYFPWATQFLTHMTIAWEISFCFLIWRPLTRPWVLLLGTGMHLGIGMFLGMWTFGTCMIFGYLAYIEPEHLRAFMRYPQSLFFRSEQNLSAIHSHMTHEQMEESESDEDFIAGRSRLIVLDREANLYPEIIPAMKEISLQCKHVLTFSELQEAIEADAEGAVLVNLNGFTDMEARDFLGSVLPFALKFTPSVTLLKKEQADWLGSIRTENYQRVLLQPCDVQQVSIEMQNAFQFFKEQFAGETMNTGKKTRESQEPLDTVFD